MSDEPLLIASLIAVAARFSPHGEPAQNQAVYEACATWIRQAVVHLLDGLPTFRNVATVEALLVLSEWPLIPFQKARLAGDGGEGEDAVGKLVAPIEQYDAFAWSYVGKWSRVKGVTMLPTVLKCLDVCVRRDGGSPRTGAGLIRA